jgi:hypothetical protein
MKQTNKVSPPLGRKPPAVGALPHPVTHSSSVHPQTLEEAASSKLSNIGNILRGAILAKLSNTGYFLNGDYWKV